MLAMRFFFRACFEPTLIIEGGFGGHQGHKDVPVCAASPAWVSFWGKTDREDPVGSYHLAAYHLLDVAASARVLLELRPRFVRHISKMLSIEPEVLIERVTFWMALHDLGKFGMSFQALSPDLCKHLHGVLPIGRPYKARHDALGQILWQRSLADRSVEDDWFGLFEEGAAKEPDDDTLEDWAELLLTFARGVFGHHGRPCDSALVDQFLCTRMDDPRTIAAADAFISELRDFLSPTRSSIEPEPTQDQRTIAARLSWSMAGLYVLADWVGSSQEHFAFYSTHIPLQEYYASIALPSAKRAVRDKMLRAAPTRSDATFTQLFPHLSSYKPRPLQRAAWAWEPEASANLIIIEDETGAGKTEAALAVAWRLMQADHADGVYVGLPTMATANAMFTRLERTYRNLFADAATPSIVLAHGHAKRSEAFQEAVARGASLDSLYDHDGLDRPAESQCAAWFASSRHLALFADVGIGTIDQALVGVLPSKYQSLRLFGVGQRVLILDEIHAYDAYTHQLVCALLEHQAIQGAHVVLLSATLPATMRAELCEAFARGAGLVAPELQDTTSYPLLTTLNAGGSSEEAIEQARRDQDTTVEFLADESKLIDELIGATTGEHAGCACWVRNTVHDALDAAALLGARPDAPEIIIFHARMILEDRLEIESRILTRFGADSCAKDRAGVIVVATQVIEQSLDVDFDFMATDLCPIDLLLQRLGRYRRHTRDQRGDRIQSDHDERGARTFHVLAPAPDADPDESWFRDAFERAAFVYPHHAQLWLTMSALSSRRTISLPRQNRELVEEVYGDEAEANTPDGLLDIEWEAALRDRDDAHLATTNALEIDEGYGGGEDVHGLWLPETSTPTRLGEPTSTLRLGVITTNRRGQEQLVPLAKLGSDRWGMSEVNIRASLVSGEDPDGRVAKLVQRARRIMPDRGRYVIIIALEKDPATGIYSGAARDASNKPVDVTYQTGVGLGVKRVS